MKNRKKTGKVSERKVGKVSVILSMAILLGILAGCGSDGKEENASAVEIIHTDTADEKSPEWEPVDEQSPDGETPASEQTDEKSASEQEGGLGQAEKGEQSLEKIYGNVKSIGDGSIVISRAFEVESDEPDAGIMVTSAEGSADEVLVTVYTSENTKYEVHTVKNGGVNGADDVESRAADWSDIKDGASVDMIGNWEGADFRAEKIIIYYYV